MSINISEVRNAVSQNEEQTIFQVEINHPVYGWIPYRLDPEDTDMTVNNSDLRSLIGSNFTQRTQQEIDAERSDFVRVQRDNLLRLEVDPIAGNALRWNSLTDAQRTAWTQYRTDLLSVPQQAGFPHNLTWPTKPN
tara:strand:- start:236 stop:643 length:408 start_codon:yes stop_codon:yes gene_type:complete